MFSSFIDPLFCHPFLLTFALAWSFLPAPGSAWRNDACFEVAAAGEPSGGLWGGSVTLGPLAWSILALGGLCCLCHMGQPPTPLSSPSPQTQSWRSYSKHEEVLSAAASWKSGLVPYNHGITWTTFHSPLPFPPWISSRNAWAAANLSIISAFQSWLTVQVSHHLSPPLFFALF